MSERDFSGAAPTDRGWLTARLTPDADSGDLPFEVRDIGNAVVARGITGKALEVPLGRYFVAARDPDGNEFAADELVSVRPGGHSVAHLRAPSRRLQVDIRAPRMAPSRSLPEGDEPAAPTADIIHARLELAGDPLLALLGAQYSGTQPGSPAAQAGTWTVAHQEPIRTTFRFPAVVEVELATGDEARMRYRSVVPADRNGPDAHEPTVLTIARARHVALGEGAELASPAEGHRFPYDLDLEFQDSRLQRFWLFIRRAAFREAWVSTEAMAPELEQSGADWMRDKLRSPVGATLGAYVLLRANRLERLSAWSENLARWFPKSPDALVVRAEVLSREGKHGDAAQLLLSLGQAGCPWIRSGVQYAWQMASAYTDARGQDELRALDDDAFARLETLRRALGRLNDNVDPRRLNTVIYWHFPERRPARSTDPS